MESADLTDLAGAFEFVVQISVVGVDTQFEQFLDNWK
jgi:hypothetical protein